MAEQGSYPLNGRTLAGTDNCTGVVTGQTADIPLSVLAAFITGGGSATSFGTTIQRLAVIPAFVGQPFFDTTLGYMMWVKQILPVIWVNATGVQQ
jgi:hypothetical protein